MILTVDTKKLKQEILNIIGDFYGLPDEEQAMDLHFQIDIAIVGSEYFGDTPLKQTKPKLRGLAKVLGKKKRAKK